MISGVICVCFSSVTGVTCVSVSSLKRLATLVIYGSNLSAVCVRVCVRLSVYISSQLLNKFFTYSSIIIIYYSVSTLYS